MSKDLKKFIRTKKYEADKMYEKTSGITREFFYGQAIMAEAILDFIEDQETNKCSKK